LKKHHFKANYHTHCDLCKHAKGNIEDYVKKAIEVGYQKIGFSDHAPFDFLEERSVRMDKEDYPEYLNQLNHVIKDYSNKIHIYRALEIEYFSDLKAHYQSLNESLDYLILGQHYIQVDDQLKSIYKIKDFNDLIIYKDTVIEAMRSGYFKIIAHPDIFLMNQFEINDDIIKLIDEIILEAKASNVLLEINANGFRKSNQKKKQVWYPRQEFWKRVSQLNAPAIISSDAHDPKHLNDDAMQKAYQFSRDLSIAVEEELVLD